MDRSKIPGGVIVVIPPILVGLLSQQFPELTVWLIVGLAVFWIASLIVWLLLRVAALQSEVNSLKSAQAQPAEKELRQPIPGQPSWKILEEGDLFLEGWQATRIYQFRRGATIKVAASGGKRFKVHLAYLKGQRKFESLRSGPETKSWMGTWEIEFDASLAIVIQPSGESPFWVHLKLEQEERPASDMTGHH